MSISCNQSRHGVQSSACMSLTEYALTFIHDIPWRDLPADVQHQAKRCLLDTLGAMVAGTQTPAARLMADFAVSQFGGNEVEILIDGRRASLVGVALASGFAANALDIDDGFRGVKGHPGACVLPALLAASQRQPVSGKEFLTALVVGYETGIRAGLIRHATYSTYHSSGSWGAIGAAVAVGRMLGLDRQALGKAIGVAEYHAPIAPMMKGIETPSMGKDSIGWGAMVGMSAALLAQEGFTGIKPLFDESPEPGWITELGTQYEILNVYAKPYACCRWAQPAIAAVLRVVQREHLPPDEIAGIRVRTFAAAASLSQAHPRNTEQAQYNLTYPVAAALLDGELGPRQVLPPRLFDKDVLALADLVSVEVKPEYDEAFPAKTYAEIELRTTDGRTLESGRMEARWEPPNMATDGELEAKFRWLVEPILGRKKSDELVESIWAFDLVDDSRELLNLGEIQ